MSRKVLEKYETNNGEINEVIKMNMKRTIVWSVIFAIGVFAVLAGKFGYIQLVQSEALQKEVVDLRVRQIKELPERGEVLDQNGKVLAMSLNAKDIAIYPNMMSSDRTREKVAELLSRELRRYGVKYEDVLEKTKAKGENGKYAPWYGIAKRVEPDIAKRIKESDVAGVIEISNSPKRYYPNGMLASSILGYVNHNNEPGSGIELSLNRYLAGTPGYTLAEMDYMKREIPIGFQNVTTPITGQKETQTIDSYIKYILEKRVEQAAEEMKAKEIHSVIINPKNGEVLAMASYPTFDPNNYTKFPQDTHNRNVSSYVYEPGSTFKPIYMAAALEGGHIKEDFSYYDGGTININGATIKNWNGQGLGQANLEDIIVNSSNVGMINISQTMTNKEVLSGLKKAGIGEKTGIELPNEEFGIIRSEEYINNDPQMKATMSFGQGLSTTPIQLITSFSEVINGGFNIQPTLVKKVEDEFGNIQYSKSEETGDRVYSEKTAEIMKRLLKANSEIGSGKDLQVEGYDSGSKTGSAWKVENGRYKSGSIVGSYMMFLPYENPEYVMLAVVDDPKNAEFGSTAAGPLVKEVMTEVLRYKAAPKTKPAEEGQPIDKPVDVSVPNMEYFLYEDAKTYLESEIKNAYVQKEGTGEVVVDQEYTSKNGKVHITLVTKKIKDKPYQHIPYLGGKTKEEVEFLLKKYSIETVFHGKGKVSEQSVQPGMYSRKINKLSFWLK